MALNNIYNLGCELIETTIVKRPSKVCKSPYVADITIDSVEICAHSPSLGCSGLANKDRKVLVTPKTNASETSVCKYSVDFGLDNGEIVAMNPKLSEKVVKAILEKNMFTSLKQSGFKPEQKIGNSRFDFVGKDENNKKFILEVKHVPLVKPDNSRIAYFPDGYRKKKTDTVSPRALKHIQELQRIKKEEPETRTIMCYVIPRTQVDIFEPNKGDPIYRNALKEAHKDGVEIIPLVVQWTRDGQCLFIRDDLPIDLIQ